ncbi:hypothetical protein ACU4GA_18320 [Methylobacterium oryzae CBMB20]
MTGTVFSRSLRARLVGATLSTAAIALAALVFLVVLRSGQTLREQAREVSTWSEAQLSDRLLSDAKLAAARLQMQREDVERRFATMAKRWDVAKAVFSGNTVAASGCSGRPWRSPTSTARSPSTRTSEP